MFHAVSIGIDIQYSASKIMTLDQSNNAKAHKNLRGLPFMTSASALEGGEGVMENLMKVTEVA